MRVEASQPEVEAILSSCRTDRVIAASVLGERLRIGESRTTIAHPKTDGRSHGRLEAQIPVSMFVGDGNVHTLAVVHIDRVLLIAEYHPPGLFGHFDVVRIHLLLGFGV